MVYIPFVQKTYRGARGK